MGTQNGNTPVRELSGREKFHLSSLEMTSSSPYSTVSSLLKSHDICRRIAMLPDLIPAFGENYTPKTAMMPLFGAYYSKNTEIAHGVLSGTLQKMPEYQKLATEDGQVTSTAMLDNFLNKLDPQKKKAVVAAAITHAANLPDVTRTDGHSTARTDSTRHIVTDISGKLLVLARHGGDLNQAILGATNPFLILRNTALADASQQSLTPESAKYAMNILSENSKYRTTTPDASGRYNRPSDFELSVLPIVLAAGARPETAITFTTWNGSISTKNPLPLSLIGDKTGKSMEALLAKGVKGDAGELFTIALIQKDSQMMKHLSGLGFDINAKDAKGQTALDRVIRANIADDMKNGSGGYALRENKDIIQSYIDGGGNAKSAMGFYNETVRLYMKDIERDAQARVREEQRSLVDIAIQAATERKELMRSIGASSFVAPAPAPRP